MSRYDSDKHHRRSIRLPGYDYSSAGAYFVTICVQGVRDVREAPLLGEIVDSEMVLNTLGCVVDECWGWLANQYPYVKLDSYVIMPNHLHGIMIITDDDGRSGSRTAPTKHKPLGRLIGAFKTVSTKKINRVMQTPGATYWQRNYWEHIIRSERALNNIRTYIATNPANWHRDRYNIQK
jgi:putative transposase